MSQRVAVRVALVSTLLGTLMNASVGVATDMLPPQWRLGWLSIPVMMIVLALIVFVETQGRDRRLLEPSVHVDLVRAVASRWGETAAHRYLDPPGPMVVPWRSAPAKVSAHVPVLWAGATRRPLPKAGSHENIYDLYRNTPTGQLVILGEPGSGKTALAVLLLRQLLQHRRSGDLVPVLVTLTEWDPGHESLQDWLTRRVERDFPGAGTQVDAERILPFLDGLDEMPAQWHAAAIAGIMVTFASSRPFVLTCRTAEYEAAISVAGEVLPTAVVVEMAPVQAADALDYLRHRALPGDLRWDPVFQHVKEEPDGHVAAVLSTPLMIWLAAKVYGPPNRDPIRMLNISDRVTLQAHLLDRYLPAIYGERPAVRWLRFLAAHMSRRGSRDLLWWRLPDELPRWAGMAVGLCVALAGAAIGSWLQAMSNPWPFNVVIAGVIALPFGIAIGLAGPPGQPAMLSRRHIISNITRVGQARMRLTIVTIAAAIVGLGMLPAVGIPGASIFVFLIVLAGFGSATLTFPDLSLLNSPRSVRTADGSALRGMLLLGIAVGVAASCFAYVAQVDFPTWLGCGIAAFVSGTTFGAATQIRHGHVWSSYTTRSFAAAAIGGTLLGALGVVIGVLAPNRLRTDLSIILVGTSLSFTIAFVGAVMMTSWLWVQLTIFVLWLRGDVPLRLMNFLDDAHKRGVLRQAGAAYQFRHALLQDRLAQPYGQHGRSRPHDNSF